MAVPVLRAVVSTPSVPPVLVMRHDPSRQPATTVVVVAGAGGAEPVGVGPGGVVGLGDELVGELVGEEVGDVVGDCVGSGDGLADVGCGDGVGAPLCDPIWPHTAPPISPTTTATTTAATTRPAVDMAPESPRVLTTAA